MKIKSYVHCLTVSRIYDITAASPQKINTENVSGIIILSRSEKTFCDKPAQREQNNCISGQIHKDKMKKNK